jgi:hypothetical protein
MHIDLSFHPLRELMKGRGKKTTGSLSAAAIKVLPEVLLEGLEFVGLSVCFQSTHHVELMRAMLNAGLGDLRHVRMRGVRPEAAGEGHRDAALSAMVALLMSSPSSVNLRRVGVGFLKDDVASSWMSEAKLAALLTRAATVATRSAKVATRSAKVTTRSAKVTTRSAQVTTRSAQVATCSAEVATCSAKVTTRSATVTTRSAEVATCSAKVMTCSAKVTTCSAKVATCSAEVATCSSGVASSTSLDQRKVGLTR